MENDGDLDLFVCCYVAWSPEIDRGQSFQLAGTGQGRAYGPPTAFNGSFCILLRNDGGRFADVSEAAGIRVRTPDLKVPVGQGARRRPLRRRRRRPGRPGRRQRHGRQLLLPQPRRRQVRGDRASPSGVAFDPSGSARGGDGDRLGRLQERRLARPGHRQLRQRDDRPLRHRRPDGPPVLRPGQPLRPRGADPAAAEVRPLLLRLRPRRPPRPALGQRPPRERHRQGPGERDLRAVGPALLEHRPAGPGPVRRWSAPRRPAPTCSGRSSAAAAPTPTSTATATSTSS